MNHNKLIATGLILAVSTFFVAGCIGGGQGNVSEQEEIEEEQPEDNITENNVTEDNVTEDNVTEDEEPEENVTDEGAKEEDEGEEKISYDYEINNCQELQDMQNDLDANYKLTQDIDCSETKNWNNGKGFKPIGRYDEEADVYMQFTGNFDGQGHTIKDLYIDRTSTNFVGLFGYTNYGARIIDVSLENADITGNKDVGGLIGWNEDGSSVSSSYATGAVTGSGKEIGGLIGKNEGSVSDCYSTGDVTGKHTVGGLIGNNLGSVSDSYASGAVTGSLADYTYVGGLIGSNKDNVSDSYSTASVTGDNYIGGLVGSNEYDGSVSDSYSTGSVTTNDDSSIYVGGLLGENDGSVSNSFWDTKTTGQSSSDGGTGLTTSEMKSKSTFTDAGWDFDSVWYMDGYPHLQWEN